MRSIKIISVFGLLGLVSGLVPYYFSPAYFLQFFLEDSYNDFLGLLLNFLLVPFYFSFFMSVSFYYLFTKIIKDEQPTKGLIYFNLYTVIGYFLSVFFLFLYDGGPFVGAEGGEEKFLPVVIFIGVIFIVLGLYKFLRYVSLFMSFLLIGGGGILGYLLVINTFYSTPYFSYSYYEKGFMFFILWQVYVAVMIGFIVNEWDKNKKISSNLNQNG